MIESGFHKSFQRLILVTCTPNQQIERFVARSGLSAEQARKRIALQIPMEEKVRYADFLIDNSSTLEASELQVYRLFQYLEDSVWQTSL